MEIMDNIKQVKSAVSLFCNESQSSFKNGSNVFNGTNAQLRTNASQNLNDNIIGWAVAYKYLKKATDRHNKKVDIGELLDTKWSIPDYRDNHGLSIPSNTEKAVMTAITLYAIQLSVPSVSREHVHVKYSKDSESSDPVTFGESLYRTSLLNNNDGIKKWILDNLQLVASSACIDDMGYYLRQIIRRDAYGFDYSQFAGELYLASLNDYCRSMAVMNWIKDFTK